MEKLTQVTKQELLRKKKNLLIKKSRSGNIGNIDMSDFGKRKLSPGEDKIRKSDMMGGTPLGMSVDEKKKLRRNMILRKQIVRVKEWANVRLVVL